jgi:hypothetical protein
VSDDGENIVIVDYSILEKHIPLEVFYPKYIVKSECFDLHTAAKNVKTKKDNPQLRSSLKDTEEYVKIKGELIAEAIEARIFISTRASKLNSIIKSGASEYLKDFDALVESFKLASIDGIIVRGSADQISALLKDKVYLVPVEALHNAYELACPEWKRKLEDKFPELFSTKSKVFKFNLINSSRLSTCCTAETPLVIGNGLKPSGYNPGEALYVDDNYKAEIINENDMQYIVFKKKIIHNLFDNQ